MRPSIPTTMLPFLRKLEARAIFTPEERQAIIELPFHPRQIHTNYDFVHRGEPVTHSCFVLDGMVATFGESRSGARQITSVFIDGDMIDLQTVVLPEAMSALQAVTTSTILQVPHAALRAIGRRYPNVAEAFWRECVADAAIVNEWVVNVGRRDARSRLAHLFCEIAWRSAPANGGDRSHFSFPITQTQLGDMLGLTPVHVNRTLKGLREDDIVVLSGRSARILDWNRMAMIGEFDPTYLRLGEMQAPEAARAS